MSEIPDTRPSDGFLKNVRQNGIYFMFPRAGAERYWASCLDDGLQELGIPTASNLNLAAWGKGASVIPGPASATLVIGDVSELEGMRTEVDQIVRFIATDPKRSLLLCMSDSVNMVDFAANTIVFAAHQNERVKRGENAYLGYSASIRMYLKRLMRRSVGSRSANRFFFEISDHHSNSQCVRFLI